MKKYLLAVLIILLPAAGAAQNPPPQNFAIDYYGYTLKLSCAVTPSALPGGGFRDLVNKDSLEVADCLAPLKKIADDRSMKGYATVLLFARFVLSLPATATQGPRTSFADAVLNKTPLGPNDQAALLFVLIAQTGTGVELFNTNAGDFIFLNLRDRIEGVNEGSYYMWMPDKSFTDLPRFNRQVMVSDKLVRQGGPVTFEKLPEIPWLMTKEGSAVSFTSPEGCPREWTFTSYRLPEYEQFLALWPRSETILGQLADQMLKPFALDQKFSPRPYDMPEDRFGSCLLNWVQSNTQYDQAHADDFHVKIRNLANKQISRDDLDLSRQNRNAVETLLVNRKGVCSELSIVLIGVLQAAGYPRNHILMATYDEGTQLAHLNLAVEPLKDELPTGAAFIELSGRKFYIMDSSVYIYDVNRKLVTKWGDSSYKDNKQATLQRLAP